MNKNKFKTEQIVSNMRQCWNKIASARFRLFEQQQSAQNSKNCAQHIGEAGIMHYVLRYGITHQTIESRTLTELREVYRSIYHCIMYMYELHAPEPFKSIHFFSPKQQPTRLSFFACPSLVCSATSVAHVMWFYYYYYLFSVLLSSLYGHNTNPKTHTERDRVRPNGIEWDSTNCQTNNPFAESFSVVVGSAIWKNSFECAMKLLLHIFGPCACHKNLVKFKLIRLNKNAPQIFEIIVYISFCSIEKRAQNPLFRLK